MTDPLEGSVYRRERAGATRFLYLHYIRFEMKKLLTMHSQRFRSCCHKPNIAHLSGKKLVLLKTGGGREGGEMGGRERVGNREVRREWGEREGGRETEERREGGGRGEGER